MLQSQPELWEQLNIDEGCWIIIKLCLKYFTTKYEVTIEKTLYAHKTWSQPGVYVTGVNHATVQ